jgi:hypothetical protein
MLGKRYLLHAAACSMALLLLSTSAWADLHGTIYNVPGNLQDATLGVPSPGTEIATICAVSGCDDITDLNFTTNGNAGTLDAFLNSAGPSVNYAFLTAADASTYGPALMSGAANPANNSQCYGNSLTSGGPDGCYSTEIEFTGTVVLVKGMTYSFLHDDGVVVNVNGSNVINAGGPTSATTDSFTYTGATAVANISIGYMATNGNPEVLQVTAPEPGSVSALLTMLAGVAGFAGILKKKLT